MCRASFFLAACLLLATGCSQQISAEGYDLTMALAQACGRQSEPATAAVRAEIEDRLSSGTLPAAEADQLLEILTIAEAGRWEDCSRQTRALMAKQRGSE